MAEDSESFERSEVAKDAEKRIGSPAGRAAYDGTALLVERILREHTIREYIRQQEKLETGQEEMNFR